MVVNNRLANIENINIKFCQQLGNSRSQAGLILNGNVDEHQLSHNDILLSQQQWLTIKRLATGGHHQAQAWACWHRHALGVLSGLSTKARHYPISIDEIQNKAKCRRGHSVILALVRPLPR